MMALLCAGIKSKGGMGMHRFMVDILHRVFFYADTAERGCSVVRASRKGAAASGIPETNSSTVCAVAGDMFLEVRNRKYSLIVYLIEYTSYGLHL